MKTNRFPSPPLRFAIYIFILSSLFLNLSSSAQTTYQVNGRTLLLQAGKYFTINNNDTLFVDTKYITIKFKSQAEHAGQLNVTSNYNLQYIGNTANTYYVFKINGTQVYPQLINELNNIDEIDQTIISYCGRYFDDKPMPNDPVPQYPNGFLYPSWWVGATNDWPPQEYLNLLGAWGYTTGKPSVIVGIIDEGCDWAQPGSFSDLPSDNLLGYNYVTNPPSQNTYPDHSVNISTHGTKMTSIICSKTNNNTDIFGIAGGWPGEGNGVKPMMIVNGKVIIGYDQYGFPIYGWSTALTPLCIDWASSHGAKVINMSFGIYGLTDSEKAIIEKSINYAISQYDVVFVAAAGNWGRAFNNLDHYEVAFPASYGPVIAVGGVDKDQLRYDHDLAKSAFGPELDFVTSFESYYNQGDAPVNPTFRVSYGTGTSLSTAMLSGVIGLMYSANPCLSSTDVIEILKRSCYKNTTDYNFIDGRNDHVGYGFPNAKKAVELALGLTLSTINGNVTWNSNRFSGNILIQPNSTLTLNNMTLQMADEKFITVDIGGKLIVNGSVITSACNTITHHWGGINVFGNYTLANTNINQQGYVKIFNNSSIENARIAVQIVSEAATPFPYGGGIVQAWNSTFLNNDKAMYFGVYPYSSRSFFDNCIFRYNQNYISDVATDQAIIRLEQIKGLQFIGCTFSNTKTPKKGIGIEAFGSSFSVQASCTSNQILPCPDNMLIHSSFENFDYGIKALWMNQATKIEKANFVNNNCGVYFSNNSYNSLISCEFKIPENSGGIERYGAYYNQCTGYHIENNKFYSEIANATGEVGLYLNNSGSYQNYVYRNTFYNLSRAAVSDGDNRSNTGNTGLCFKCNDFSTNGTDIDVILTPGTSTTPYSGIARKQGAFYDENPTNPLPDTLAAANTFTQSTTYNVRNLSGNVSNYVYHANNNTVYKIIPVYLHLTPESWINNFNHNTTYSRTTICKPWINNGGSIQQQLAQKSAAKANAEATGLQLQNLLDGGSTENLTFDILGGTPLDAIELRDQLLTESPYLSDTVLKTAIEQENALPNALLRDVLVENPQAAKSANIMGALDGRYEPMPDYMKIEIEAGKYIVGGREKLESVQAAWQQKEGLLFNQIVSNYLSDTLNPNAISELKTFLQNENTSQAGFLLADINLQQLDYPAALLSINTMQANLTLDLDQSQQANDYLTLIGIMQTLESNHISPFAVDSSHAIPLFNFYQSGNNKACAMARDMLISSGLLNYQEPINDSSILKSSEVKPIIPVSKGSNTSENLRLFPNPAGAFTVVEYMLPAKTANATLIVYSVSGIAVWKQDVKKARDQIVIDLSGFNAGIYKVSLAAGNKILTSKSLTVSK